MPRKPIGDKAMTDAERQRRRRAHLQKERQATAPPEPTSHDRLRQDIEIDRLHREIDGLRQRNRGLENELAVRPAKPALTPPTDADRVIIRLTQQLRTARAEIRHLREWSKKTGLPERGGMSLATHRKLIRVLHPDRQPTEAERTEACQAFNVWADSHGRAVKYT